MWANFLCGAVQPRCGGPGGGRKRTTHTRREGGACVDGRIAMGVAIEVSGLTKSFGSSRIWEDVTLDIPAGEVSVLLGPSGTGKSVFLKSLIGLLRTERGSILIDGTNISACRAKERYGV